MKPLAGVIENAPRLGQNLLPKEEPNEKLPVRFSALPPLVQTPLVSGTPKQAFEEKDEKAEPAPGKKTAEAALPPGMLFGYYQSCSKILTSVQ